MPTEREKDEQIKKIINNLQICSLPYKDDWRCFIQPFANYAYCKLSMPKYEISVLFVNIQCKKNLFGKNVAFPKYKVWPALLLLLPYY